MTEPLPQRSCFQKARYATLEWAESIARKCLRERGHVLRVYLCEVCGGHHLTSTNVAQVEAKSGWRPPRVSARDEASERRFRQPKRATRSPTGRQTR